MYCQSCRLVTQGQRAVPVPTRLTQMNERQFPRCPQQDNLIWPLQPPHYWPYRPDPDPSNIDPCTHTTLSQCHGLQEAALHDDEDDDEYGTALGAATAAAKMARVQAAQVMQAMAPQAAADAANGAAGVDGGGGLGGALATAGSADDGTVGLDGADAYGPQVSWGLRVT